MSFGKKNIREPMTPHLLRPSNSLRSIPRSRLGGGWTGGSYMKSEKLRVFASRAEDVHSGHIWLPERIVRQWAGQRTGQRIVVKIRNVNSESGKFVFCEVVSMGNDFVRNYNNSEYRIHIDDKKNSVVMSEWYRDKIGVKSQEFYNFEIRQACRLQSGMHASFDHPQVVVRAAVTLGAISVVFGAVGFVLGVLGLFLGLCK